MGRLPAGTVLPAIGSLVLAALVAVGVVFGIPILREAAAERTLLAKIEGNKDANEAYDSVKKAVEGRTRDPKNAAWYVQEANGWILIADLLDDQLARRHAIAADERAVAAFGKGNALIVVNLGNAYRDAGRYADAERTYRTAIETNPGDPRAYEELVGLYRLKMGKPPEAVIGVFKEALTKLLDNERMVQLLAEYLVVIGRERDALQYYGLLQKRYPGQFDQIVRDLEAKTASSGTPR